MTRTDVTVHVPAIIAAAGRQDVVHAMRRFYERADREIAVQSATCWNRGECCRFGQFGHRLYVTSLEVCYYVATGEMPPPIVDDACPHAYDGKCHARARRPFGCRVYYCDANAQAWQGPLTEKYLATLREMHRQLDVPYIYADWMSFLAALQQQTMD